MRKYSLLVLFAFLITASLIFASCGGNGDDLDGPVEIPDFPDIDLTANWAENRLEVSSIPIRRTFGEARYVLRVNSEFPQIGIEGIDEYFANLREDYTRQFEAFAENAEPDTPYRVSANFSVEINSGGIFSVLREVRNNIGGTRPRTELFAETFSIRTGNLLALDDLFSVSREEYLPKLLLFVFAEIDKNPENFWADARTNARAAFPFNSFTISPNGITLYFPENNLAPRAVDVLIPWGWIHEIFEVP